MPDAELMPVVCRFEKSPDGEISLPGLTGHLSLAGCDAHRLWSLPSIAGAGGMLDSYTGRRFRHAGRTAFRGEDRFPRIVRTSFRDGDLPRGIVDLDYEIDPVAAGIVELYDEAIAEMYDRLISGEFDESA